VSFGKIIKEAQSCWGIKEGISVRLSI
jgi:hypothetical protein